MTDQQLVVVRDGAAVEVGLKMNRFVDAEVNLEIGVIPFLAERYRAKRVKRVLWKPSMLLSWVEVWV